MKDDLTIPNLESLRKVYVKDLGPQIGWNTVFLLEYAGPLFIYAAVATRPWILYGTYSNEPEITTTAKYVLKRVDSSFTAKRKMVTMYLYIYFLELPLHAGVCTI